MVEVATGPMLVGGLDGLDGAQAHVVVVREQHVDVVATDGFQERFHHFLAARAGEVAALGSGISNIAVGDQVFGVTNTQFLGAYAEYAVASAAIANGWCESPVTVHLAGGDLVTDWAGRS